MRKFLMAAALLGATTAWQAPALAQEGDAARGEQVFRKCMACHRVGEGARNLVGPVLNGVYGRQAGTVEGFRYSDLNKAAGEAGLVWTTERLVEYLPDPNAFLRNFLTQAGRPVPSGSTRMTFRLPDAQEARDVAAYIRQFSN
jgi:cytochrome c